MKKKQAMLFIIIFVLIVFGSTVFAAYGSWVPLTGSDIFHGEIRAGWIDYHYDSGGLWVKNASTQSKVYNSDNVAVWHYSRTKVVNLIFPFIEYGDSGRHWATYTATATTHNYNANEPLFSIRSYWGTN